MRQVTKYGKVLFDGVKRSVYFSHLAIIWLCYSRLKV